MPVLAGNVTPNRVVAGEGTVAEWTRDPNALVALANVGPQVCLVSVGALAKRAFKLGAYKKLRYYLNQNIYLD